MKPHYLHLCAMTVLMLSCCTVAERQLPQPPRGSFDEPQYMFFDTEVFTWYGWPTRASLLDPTKNTMLVDWVRAWQLVDDLGMAVD